MNNVKRLFIAEYEDANTWTDNKRTILTKILDGDLYLIFKTGKNEKLSSTMVQLMNDMSKNGQIVDVTSMNNEEYGSKIIELIKENANKNTEIYFLHMDTMYHQLKNQLNEYRIQMRRNYKVGRNTNQNKSKMVDPTGKDIFKAMANALNDAEPINKNEEKEDFEPKINKENKQKTQDKPINNTPKKQKVDTPEVNIEDEISIKDLERIIFGNKVISKEFKVTYTELDNAKAKLISLLFDRMVESIKSLIKNIKECDFTTHQYLNLVTTLIKSNSYTDFILSYEVVEPGFKLDLKLDVYNYLYEEACYYSKVCKVLYDEDLWA